MSDIDEMVAWLRGVLDADERLANNARGVLGVVNPWWRWEDLKQRFPGITGADAMHIARHDPAHVLNVVAAHRAIIDEVMSWRHFYLDEDGWYSCAQAVDPSDTAAGPGSGCIDDALRGKPCDCGLDRRRRAILGPLTAGYAGRDGYRAEWAPQ